MGKILSEFVKENLGKKVLIFNKSNMDEIELIENFGIDIIDVSINLNTVKLQEELSPLEEETLILSDFWY